MHDLTHAHAAYQQLGSRAAAAIALHEATDPASSNVGSEGLYAALQSPEELPRLAEGALIQGSIPAPFSCDSDTELLSLGVCSVRGACLMRSRAVTLPAR